MPKYNVNQYPVSSILTWVKDGEISSEAKPPNFFMLDLQKPNPEPYY